MTHKWYHQSRSGPGPHVGFLHLQQRWCPTSRMSQALLAPFPHITIRERHNLKFASTRLRDDARNLTTKTARSIKSKHPARLIHINPSPQSNVAYAPKVQ